MRVLVAGQNALLAQRLLRFSVDAGSGTKASALLVDEQRRALSPELPPAPDGRAQPGVELRDGVVHVDLDKLPSGARVLCIASSESAPVEAALGCRITGSGDAETVFTVAAGDVHRAMICFELYLRGTQWKVRAVGQGYAGGLSELLRAHGVTAIAADVQLLDHGDPLKRIGMIFEDAARSTAAFLSASDYATMRLDDEMSAAVADPATRTTPAAAAAAAAANRRHDELVARAQAAYDRDAAFLVSEIAALDAELPPALASWGSIAWHRAPAPGNGIRIGEVSAPEVGPLTVPFGVSAPLHRPIWVDTHESAPAAPVVTALVLRLLAATPRPTPTLDVIDVGGTLQPFWEPLTGRMARPVVRDHHAVAARLRELITAADLAGLRGQVEGTVAAAGILVIADIGYGMPAETIGDVAVLINKAAAAHLSIVFVGESGWDSAMPAPLLRDIDDCCLHVSTDTQGSAMYDPWTRNVWQFMPDMAPTDTRLAHLIASLAALTPERPPANPGRAAD